MFGQNELLGEATLSRKAVRAEIALFSCDSWCKCSALAMSALPWRRDRFFSGLGPAPTAPTCVVTFISVWAEVGGDVHLCIFTLSKIYISCKKVCSVATTVRYRSYPLGPRIAVCRTSSTQYALVSDSTSLGPFLSRPLSLVGALIVPPAENIGSAHLELREGVVPLDP